MKVATARIKINKLLEKAGWRFFADENGPANIQLEPSVKLKQQDLDALGENFEKSGDASADEEERRYADPDAEIREVLVHGYYLSQKDIEICAAHDITRYSSHPHFASIEALHDSRRAAYLEQEPAEPATVTP